MSGIFEVLASSDADTQRLARQATVASQARVEERFGKFISVAHGPEKRDRLNFIFADVADIVTATCDEFGYDDPSSVIAAIRQSWGNPGDGYGDLEHERPHELYPVSEEFQPCPQCGGFVGPDGRCENCGYHLEHGDPFEQLEGGPIPGESPDPYLHAKTAARKPKMCPYHKEVTSISLASGEPQAGFNAMAQHAWGANHCDGEYEGGCNFKPEMVTQSYWDTKAERAEERRREREEALAEQELADQPLGEQPEEPEVAEPEPVAEETPDNVIEVDFGAEEQVAEPEIPMAMAASVQKHSPGKKHLPGASDKENSQYEHIKENYEEDGKDEDEAKELAARTVNKQKSSEALETVDVQGTEGPVPKIDERKWTPSTVPAIDADSSDGPHPTRTKDVVDPIVAENANALEEIGDQVTETVDVTQDKAELERHHTETFPKGDQADPVTSGFLSPEAVQKAVEQSQSS